GVNPNANRLMERPDQVLGFRMVNAGLAAHRAIHHGEQSGWNHQEWQPPVIGRRYEPGQVADDAATNGHDHGLPIRLEVREVIVEERGAAQGFLLLARTKDGLTNADADHSPC